MNQRKKHILEKNHMKKDILEMNHMKKDIVEKKEVDPNHGIPWLKTLENILGKELDHVQILEDLVEK